MSSDSPAAGSNAKLNMAAWLPSPGGNIEVGPAPLWVPEKGQVRIKIHTAPLTPADALFASKSPPFQLTYPTIISSIMAGTVDALGEDVSKVKVGDRIVSGTAIWTSRGDARFGGLQRFGIVDEKEIIEIGDTPYDIAITSTMQTAAGALFSPLHLNLARPILPPPSSTPFEPLKTGKKILIWGGSSAMGAVSISHAVAAGYEVVTTCSPRNFEMVKSLGARWVFDYSREEETIAAILGLGPLEAYYDCVSLPGSVGAVVKLLVGDGVEGCEGGKKEGDEKEEKVLWTLTPPSMHGNPILPEGVKTKMVMFRSGAVENEELVEWMLKTGGYLERGVKEGWLRGVEGESVGGLEGAQAGLERRGLPGLGGVSGKRLVVEPWL